MIIYDVVIKDANGKVKEVIPAEELSDRHWDSFLDYEPLDLGLPSEVTDIGEDQQSLDKFAKEEK